jgi:hypothetical protein
MKTNRLFLALIVLVLASLACQAISGGSSTEAPAVPAGGGDSGDTEAPTEEGSGGGSPTVDADFPMPSDASNVMELGNGVLNFQTKSTLDECMAFYRDEFVGGMGYKEREILTVTSETTFSMVFDGHASGKAIVVQGVDLGDGTTNISIRLEDA